MTEMVPKLHDMPAEQIIKTLIRGMSEDLSFEEILDIEGATADELLILNGAIAMIMANSEGIIRALLAEDS